MSQFTISIKGLDEAKFLLQGIKNGSRKAIVRALNKTVGTTTGGVRSDASKAVAGSINLAQTVIKKDFSVAKATYSNLSAHVRAKGLPIALGKFKGTRQTKKGISVQVKKNRPRKVIRRAFIPKLKSGHKGVFWRTGKERLPIDQRFGPRVPDILSNEPVMNPILEKAEVRLDKNFAHEVDHLLESSK